MEQTEWWEQVVGGGPQLLDGAPLGDPTDPESAAWSVISQDVWETWTAEVVASAESVTERAAHSPEERLRDGLEAAGAGLADAAVGPGLLPRVGATGLGDGLASAADIALRLEALTYAVAREACARGLHTAAGFGLVDWLAGRCGWMDRAHLAQVATVARACEHLQNTAVGEAVSEGRFPVRRGAIILRALEKVRGLLDPDQYESYVTILVDAAADAKLTDTQLRRAAEHLLALVLDEEEADRRERAASEMRSVRSHHVGKGVKRFVIDAPARQAAILEGILTSRLAKPVKGPDDERDPRSAAQRQFDALMTVVGRGLAAPEGVPQTARATLFITMQLDHLRRDTPGHGTTLTGGSLSARQVRQAACEAEIIPVVLGGEGQILDMGRAVRLATPAQVKALYLRDQGCTFPGCSVPAQWTIAHHHPWFSRGGATDLDKLALLCEPHHTHVHENDLECTIDDSGVTWHER